MDVGQIISRLSASLDGFDESVAENLDDPYFMAAIDEAVLECKKELKIPIAEVDITLTSGERGFTLPTSPQWYDWADELTAIRLDPGSGSTGQDSEGTYVTIVSEHSLFS